MSEHKWISAAIKHSGVFRKAAEKAGMSTESFARKHEHASGVLGHRARLALTLMHLNGHDESAEHHGDAQPPSEYDEYKGDVSSAVKRYGRRKR